MRDSTAPLLDIQKLIQENTKDVLDLFFLAIAGCKVLYFTWFKYKNASYE